MTTKLKADLSLLAITVFWGASFPIISKILKYIPPYSLMALRYLLAGVILLAVTYKNFKNIEMKVIKAGILIGISLFLGCAFQFVGLLYTTSSKSGFITGLNVAIVPIILAFGYKRFPDLKTVFGIILSVIGLAFISLNGSKSINIGDFLTLLCAVAFAAQIILVDLYAKDADPLLITCIQSLTVGILAIPPSIFVEKLKITFNLFSVVSLLFMVIFCTIAAYVVQNKMQKYTSPTHAAVIFLAEPVFGAIFSTFIGDRLSGKTLIGCIMIFIGMAVINLKVKMQPSNLNQNKS
ncbi:DMT family transporter [Clostridium sp. JN-1]|jgi:drug/metabolite transporter (DMT)-like permease|uniref:DMT family transporter n=1 Tax=Clostridium sp. JN-1 TaxID=2483110 RepID=UPI000F0BB613|nr:DMT family transporter [Clostridium sp. JN-1]